MFWKTNKKLLGNSCFDISCKSCLNISCKSYFDILHILIFVNLQNSKECPPTLSVPSYLLVIKYEWKKIFSNAVQSNQRSSFATHFCSHEFALAFLFMCIKKWRVSMQSNAAVKWVLGFISATCDISAAFWFILIRNSRIQNIQEYFFQYSRTFL